jgi:hypothetical protein
MKTKPKKTAKRIRLVICLDKLINPRTITEGVEKIVNCISDVSMSRKAFVKSFEVPSRIKCPDGTWIQNYLRNKAVITFVTSKKC